MTRPAAPAASPATPIAGQGCTPVPVEPGGAVEVGGEPPACYELPVEPGQRARVQVVDGPDALFSVDGLASGQEDYGFVVEGGPVRIRVASESGAPFVLRLTVTAAGAPGDWRIEEAEGRATGLAWIAAKGGPSITLTCASGGSGVGLTYDGVGTVALTRPEAVEAPGMVEIEVGGEMRRHPITLRRIDGFDRYWEAVEGLGESLLDDFARGSILRLLDAEGAVAGRVGLVGSARLRDAIARSCGL